MVAVEKEKTMVVESPLKSITGYFNVEPVKVGMKEWKAQYDKLTDADKTELHALIMAERENAGK